MITNCFSSTVDRANPYLSVHLPQTTKIMSHQYSITTNYKESDNVVFTLVENRVSIGLNHLLIDLQDDDNNQIQFFAVSTLQVIQSLLPDCEVVQEY